MPKRLVKYSDLSTQRIKVRLTGRQFSALFATFKMKTSKFEMLLSRMLMIQMESLK